jgi:Flp pilus assembly protein TadG
MRNFFTKPNQNIRVEMRSVVAGRGGTAAVEFAICIPMLMLFALASADFGRIAFFHQVVCNAARTGAETGATHKFTAYTQDSWEDGVHQAVLSEMQNMPNFDSGQLGYELSTVADADGLARINVSVTYPFRTVVAWPGLPSNVTLHKTVEFREFR